jgi:hypothetical protein
MSTERQIGSAALAMIAGIGGRIVTFVGRPGWGLPIEMLAVICGAVGLASQRRSGTTLSVAAILLAAFGYGLSVLVLVGTVAP